MKQIIQKKYMDFNTLIDEIYTGGFILNIHGIKPCVQFYLNSNIFIVCFTKLEAK